MPASAADGSFVTVSGGSLGITNPQVGDFAAVTLNGTDQTSTATMDPFTVTDGRATGAGWNVTISATQFAEWETAAYIAGGKLLPASSLTMPALTVAKDDPSSSAVPSITAGPYTIDSGSAVKLASADADGTGMGSYIFSQSGPLSLSVPASAFAKLYRSDVTVSVNSGP